MEWDGNHFLDSHPIIMCKPLCPSVSPDNGNYPIMKSMGPCSSEVSIMGAFHGACIYEAQSAI